MTGIVKEFDFGITYLDDIIIFSRMAEEHLSHIKRVFEKLRNAKLSMKFSKCHFFTKEIQYLGHILNSKASDHYLQKHKYPDQAHAHRLTLAIAKKTLDENHFRTAQKTMDRQPPSFKIGDRVYFKNKQPGKWDLKWRPGYRIVWIEHNGHLPSHRIPSNPKSMILQCEGCSSQTSYRILKHRYSILAELENMSFILQIYLLYVFVIKWKPLLCT